MVCRNHGPNTVEGCVACVPIIISCPCSHMGHSIRFAYYPVTKRRKDEPFEAYVDVMLDSGSLWSRIKMAWRYVTRNTCGYGSVAECLLNRDDLPKIRAWLELAEKDAVSR